MTTETSSPDAASARRARLRLGSAPDSWGVWFPDDHATGRPAHQGPWRTDPETVFLCLDIGHLSYYDGDNLAVIHRFGERIGCLHIKQAVPAVLKRVRAEDFSFFSGRPLPIATRTREYLGQCGLGPGPREG